MYRIATTDNTKQEPQLPHLLGILILTVSNLQRITLLVLARPQLKAIKLCNSSFHVDSGCTKAHDGQSQAVCKFMEKLGTMFHFGNDQFAPILGYGDLIQGNVTIKRVYYVEGLNHNLFSVGQFCDADLEVALEIYLLCERTSGNDFY
ncbi:hypothetical protein Tco_1568872 [Tanacetum coccineum]